jgi:hypothetical protein
MDLDSNVGTDPFVGAPYTGLAESDTPGTLFATARVTSHRSGEVAAISYRTAKLASGRVVVT